MTPASSKRCTTPHPTSRRSAWSRRSRAAGPVGLATAGSPPPRSHSSRSSRSARSRCSSTRDDGSSPHIAAPGAELQARVIDGDGAVDGRGQGGSPARVSSSTRIRSCSARRCSSAPTALSVASYDAGPDGVAPSHVVRIDGRHVVDIVDFKATRVLSIAEGEGARWVLTQNREPTGGTVPDSFLKRITGSDAPQSTPLPARTPNPSGPIAAVGRRGMGPGARRRAAVRPRPDALVGMTTAARRVSPLGRTGRQACDRDRRKAAPRPRRSTRVKPASTTDRPTAPEILGLAAAGFDESRAARG